MILSITIWSGFYVICSQHVLIMSGSNKHEMTVFARHRCYGYKTCSEISLCVKLQVYSIPCFKQCWNSSEQPRSAHRPKVWAVVIPLILCSIYSPAQREFPTAAWGVCVGGGVGVGWGGGRGGWNWKRWTCKGQLKIHWHRGVQPRLSPLRT